MATRSLGTLSVSFTADIKKFLDGLSAVQDRLVQIGKLQEQAFGQGASASQTASERFKALEGLVMGIGGAITDLGGQIIGLRAAITDTAGFFDRLGSAADRITQATARIGQTARRVRDDTRRMSSGISEDLAAVQRHASATFGPDSPVFGRTSGVFGNTIRRGLQQFGVDITRIAVQMRTQFSQAFSQGLSNFARDVSVVARLIQLQIGRGLARAFEEVGAAARRQISTIEHLQRRIRDGLGRAFGQVAAGIEQQMRQVGIGISRAFSGIGRGAEIRAAQNLFTNLRQTAVQAEGGIDGVRRGLDRVTDGAERSRRGFGTLQQQIVQLAGGDGTGGFFGRMARGWVEGVKRIIIFQTRWFASVQVIFAAVNTLRTGIRTFVEFGDVMAQVAAIARTTEEETRQLAEAAREVGRTTIFSATEAAEALQLLAQAGFTAQESIAALEGVTTLAGGGVASMEDSVRLLTTTIRAFNLSASQTTEVANTLVAVVNQSKTSIEDLNITMNFAANAAAGAGLSIEDLGAALGVLADNGIRASTQGTAIRQVLAALINPTQRARDVFDRLGLSLDQLNPIGKDFVTVLRTLRDAGFGTQEAFEAFERRTGAAAAVLVRSVDAIEDMRNRITGTNDALDAFRRRQESLSAQAGITAGKLRDTAIAIGEDLTPALLALFRTLQGTLDALRTFSSLAVGALAAPVLISGVRRLGVLFQGVRFPLEATNRAMTEGITASALLTARYERLALILRGLLRFLAVAAAVGAVIEALRRGREASEDFENQLDSQTDAAIRLEESLSKLVPRLTNAIRVLRETRPGALEAAAAQRNLSAALILLRARLPEATERMQRLIEAAIRSSEPLSDVARKLREIVAAATLGQQLQQFEGQAAALRRQIEQLKTGLDALAAGDQLGPTLSIFENKLSAITERSTRLRERLDFLFGEGTSGFRALAELVKDFQTELDTLGPERASATLDQIERAAADVATKQALIAGALKENTDESVRFRDAFLKASADLEISTEDILEILEDVADVSRNDVGPDVQLAFKLASDAVNQARNALQGYGASLDNVIARVAELRKETEELRRENDAEAQALHERRRLLQETGLSDEEMEREEALLEAVRRRTAAIHKLEDEREKELEQLVRGTSFDELKAQADSANEVVAERARRRIAEIEEFRSATNALIDEEERRLEIDRHNIRIDFEKRIQRQIRDGELERDKLNADLSGARLEREGRIVAAVREQFAVERARIEATTSSDPRLRQILLDNAALREQLAIEEALRAERAATLEISDRALALREAEIDLIASRREQELDLEEQQFERGQIRRGRAAFEAEHQRRELRKDIDLIELRKGIETERIRLLDDELASNRLLSREEQAALRNEIAAHQINLIALNDQQTALRQNIELIREAGTVSLDLAQIWENNISDAIRGIAQGTLELKDIFSSTMDAMIAEFGRFVAQSLVEKLEFDQVFEGNVIDLGNKLFSSLFGGITSAFSAASGSQGIAGFSNAIINSITGPLQGLGSGLINTIRGGVVQTGTGAQAGFTSFAAGGATQRLVTPTGAVISATGEQAAQAGPRLLGATLGQLVALIGSVVALVDTLRGAADAFSKADDVTAGQAGPRNALRGFQVGTLVAGVGAGTAVGAAVGAGAGSVVPGIGTVVGGVVGAAIGAAIAKAITDAITNAIGGGVNKAVREGLTQEQLDKEIRNDPGTRAVGAVLTGGGTEISRLLGGGIGGNIGGAFLGGSLLGSGAILAGAAPVLLGPIALAAFGLIAGFQALLSAMTPDIEEVFDDLFVDVFQSMGVRLSDRLEGFLGEDLGPRARTRLTELFGSVSQDVQAASDNLVEGTVGEVARGGRRIVADLDNELTQRSFDTIRIVSALIGAGTDNEERIKRFFTIFANSVARLGKTTEQVNRILDQTIRRLSGGSLTNGLALLTDLFGRNARNAGLFGRQVESLADAFQELDFFRALDISAFLNVAEQGRAGTEALRNRGAKPARKAIREGLGDLFAAEEFEDGLDAFTSTLRDKMREAIVGGFQQALLRTAGLDLILTEFFGRLKRVFNKAMRFGPTDQILAEFDDLMTSAVSRTTRMIQIVTPFLADMFERINEALDRLDDQLKTAAERFEERLDRLDLARQVEEQLAGIFLGIQKTVQELVDARLRLDQKLFQTQGGEGTRPGTANDLLRAAAAQQVIFLSTIKDVFSPDRQLESLALIESTVDQFLNTAVQEITETFGPAIELARKAQSIVEAVQDQIRTLRTSRDDPRATVDKLEDVRREISEQRAIMLAGTPEEQLEAARKLQDLNQELIAIGRDELDQSGPQFRALVAEIIDNLRSVETFLGDQTGSLESLERQQEERLREVRDQAAGFYEFVKSQALPLLEQKLTDEATKADALLMFLKEKFDVDFPAQMTALIAGISEFISGQTDTLLGVDGLFKEGSPLANLSETLSGAFDPETGVFADMRGGIEDIADLISGASESVLKEIERAIRGLDLGAGPEPGPDDQPPGGPKGGVEGGGLGLASRAQTRAARDLFRQEFKGLGGVNALLSTPDVLEAAARAFQESVQRAIIGTTDQVKARTFALFRDFGGAILRSLIPKFDPTMTYVEVAQVSALIKQMFQDAGAPRDLPEKTFRDAIDSFFFRLESLKPIAKLAEGGIVRTATQALIGEAGPEAVLPLNQQGMSMIVEAISSVVAQSSSVSRALAELTTRGTTGPANGGAVEITLNVNEGAFRAELHGADPAVVRQLPEQMLDALKRSIRHGELGAVIERRVNRR